MAVADDVVPDGAAGDKMGKFSGADALEMGSYGYFGTKAGVTRFRRLDPGQREDRVLIRNSRLRLNVATVIYGSLDNVRRRGNRKAKAGKPFTAVAKEGETYLLIEFEPAQWFEKATEEEVTRFVPLFSQHTAWREVRGLKKKYEDLRKAKGKVEEAERLYILLGDIP